MPIKKEVDINFFKKWSHEMSYILGFFVADGYMIKNRRGAHFIEFHITDKEILDSIQISLRSNHKISITPAKGNIKTLYKLQIGSKEIFSDLSRLGMSQKKSKVIRLPKIPKEFVNDFVRGYFDGDGSVYFKEHYAKDRKKMRWVFHTRFTSGSLLFLKDLQKLLQNTAHGGFIVEKISKGKFTGYELVFSHKDSLALFCLMYNNSSSKLFLKRKYNLFKKALQTLYGFQVRV